MTANNRALRIRRINTRLCALTLDRPPANALTSELIHAITCAVQELARREEPPVLLLAAEGERFFCAGGDIKELDGADVGHAARRMDGFHHMLAALAAYPTAIVVAVRGYAAGGGLELTLMGDVVIAGEKAQFGFPEIRHGLMPAVFGIRRAVDLIGRRAAFDLLSNGRFLAAREALALGLVNRVVADDAVLAAATEAAAGLAEKDPLILGILKRAVAATDLAEPEAMRQHTDAEFRRILARPASVEARQRFLVKGKV